MVSTSAMTHAMPDGHKLELHVRGDGPVLLVLHEGTGLIADAPYLDQLSGSHRVIVPSHPGFDGSERPDGFDSVDDLAYLYLDLLDDLGIDRCSLLGCCFGGWIAAELAVRAPHRFDKLVLAGAVGIRVGGITDRDITDVWGIGFAELAERWVHDPALAERLFGFSEKDDDDVVAWARNNDTLALYAWEPYLHSPKLRARLARVRAATLVVWGRYDGIVGEAYGRAYADAIPGARFELIDGAAHVPQLERPDEFAGLVGDFLGGGGS
jgi:pimeloyl-ACP methyl ester carboxylesterase